MSTFMLDTDTCAFILRKSSPALMQRIQAGLGTQMPGKWRNVPYQ